MAAALVPLQNITLGSAAASVTFANIPSIGFRDLRVVFYASQTSAATPSYRLNGNATSGSYSMVGMSGTSSAGSTSNASFTSCSIGWFFAAPATNSWFNGSLDIFDAFATDKHKTALGRGSEAGVEVSASASRFASTAAVSSVTLLGIQGAGTWAAGSTFALYGVVA